MSRFSKSVRGALASLLIAAALAGAADILVDDFTNPVASITKWTNTLPAENMTVSVAGGSLTMNNTSTYGGEYLHTFSGTKPSTFTISFVLKSSTGATANANAGVFFCKSASNFSGYQITILGGNMVSLYKWDNGKGNTIYHERSDDLKAADNKLAVSKNGQEIHIFLNDVFQGKVTDNQFASGDVSFFVPGGMSAVFGDFRMTDTFTAGGPRGAFYDNFNGNGLKYWQYLKIGNPDIKEEGGVLKMKTGASASSWMYVDLSVANFTARVEARYVSGGTTTPYGIVLVGQGQGSQGQVPMVNFAIMGNRRWAVWSDRDPSYTPALSNDIYGAAGIDMGLVLVDTLQVVKKSGVSSFEFFVNGKPLTPNYSASNFTVIGIGIFCYEGMEIHFDNFSAIKEGLVSIRRDLQTARRTTPVIRNNNPAVYDLKGRKLGKVTPTIPGRVPVRAQGVYVSENGREVIIRRK